jgi:predicted dehydrogenase
MDRRRFLQRSSLGTLIGLAGAGDLLHGARAGARRQGTRPDEQLACAVVGFGEWGRQVALEVEDVPELRLAAVCDEYPVMLRRAQRAHPDAARHASVDAVLDDPAIPAVLVATPTHRHLEVVRKALAAGKHVYCEAPMAASIEDARAIAEAAAGAQGQIFQVGLHLRTEPQYRSVFQFIRSGALGRAAMGRAQWHAKESWRRASPDPERQRAQNWRLDPEISLGLVGETGMQQMDAANWVFGDYPVAVTGFGSTLYWTDGRDLPDTVQAVFEYPGGQRMLWNGTLVSSFDSAHEVFYGSDSTIMLRDQKAWMFKEVDAPMLGWEVYARKDKFYRETGIALIANATKLEAQGLDPAADDPNRKSPLWHALKAFADNYFFGPYPPVADHVLGYANTVLAVRARQAVAGQRRVVIDPAEYVL